MNIAFMQGGPGVDADYLKPLAASLFDFGMPVFALEHARDIDQAPSLTTDVMAHRLSAACGNGPAIVVTHSWGNHVLMHGLLKGIITPEKLAGVIAIAPMPLTARALGTARDRLMARFDDRQLGEIADLKKRVDAEPDDRALGRRFMRLIAPAYMANPDLSPAVVGDYYSRSAARLGVEIKEYDVTGAVRLLPMRTLVIYGSHDYIRPEDNPDLNTQADIVSVVPGAGHYPFIDQPGETLSLVRNYASLCLAR